MENDLELKIIQLEQKIDRLTRMIVWARRWGYIRILVFYVLPVVLLYIYAVPFVRTVQERIDSFMNFGQRQGVSSNSSGTTPLIQQYLRSSGISIEAACREFCPTQK